MRWFGCDPGARKRTRIGCRSPLTFFSLGRVRGMVFGCLWIGRLWLFIGIIAVAMADDSAPSESGSGHRSFDIPSKSLSTALSDYSAATGIGVLVDGGVTAGRMSAPVKGVLTPPEALQALLEKSGLTVRYANPTAFTLVPAPPEPGRGADLAREHYFAAVQAAVARALCKSADTRPGQYRSAVRLWIDRSGLVQRSELLGSSGKPERDAAIGQLLRDLEIEARPTFSLPQPVTVALLLRDQDQSVDPSVDRVFRR